MQPGEGERNGRLKMVRIKSFIICMHLVPSHISPDDQSFPGREVMQSGRPDFLGNAYVYCQRTRALTFETADFNETLVYVYQNTRRRSPEHSSVRIHRLQNLRPHKLFQLMQPIFIQLITNVVVTEQVDSSAEARGQEVPFVLPSHQSYFYCKRWPATNCII